MKNTVLNMIQNSDGIYTYNPLQISQNNIMPYQPIIHNDFHILNEIINRNNNLISKLNGLSSNEIRLWKDPQNNYYFIDNAGQEHKGTKDEIESILTGTIGKQITIVDDVHSVKTDSYSLINTIYLSIISIPLVLEETFKFHSNYNTTLSQKLPHFE